MEFPFSINWFLDPIRLQAICLTKEVLDRVMPAQATHFTNFTCFTFSLLLLNSSRPCRHCKSGERAGNQSLSDSTTEQNQACSIYLGLSVTRAKLNGTENPSPRGMLRPHPFAFDGGSLSMTAALNSMNRANLTICASRVDPV